MAHSKAPWKVVRKERHEGGELVTAVHDANGDCVCDDQTFYPQALNPDNADVIAAAPELLAQLIRLRLAFTIAVGELSPFAKQALGPVDEVIAAAGGEEQ